MRHAIDLFADQFVICAGSVLFKLSDEGRLRICILHKRSKDEWYLPKGRKDRGETIQDTAVRETTEETGFRCALFPVSLHTRATIPSLDQKDRPRFQRLSQEPFATTVRYLSDTGRNVKMIYWFVTRAEEGESQMEGTQMPSENFDAGFYEPDEVIEKLTLPGQQSLVEEALRLIRNTLSSET